MHYTEQVQGEATGRLLWRVDDEPSSSLKEILSELEGVYQHTRIQTGTIAPVDYNALVRGIEVNEAHSAIVESQAFNSSTKKEAYMAGTLEEVAKRFEEQAQIQREQFDMRAQKDSINTLK